MRAELTFPPGNDHYMTEDIFRGWNSIFTVNRARKPSNLVTCEWRHIHHHIQGITTQISAGEETTLHYKPRTPKQRHSEQSTAQSTPIVSGQLNCLLGFTAYKGNLRWLSQQAAADVNIFWDECHSKWQGNAHLWDVHRKNLQGRRTGLVNRDIQTVGRAFRCDYRIKSRDKHMSLVNLEFLFYFYIFQSCHRDTMSLNMWGGSRRKGSMSRRWILPIHVLSTLRTLLQGKIISLAASLQILPAEN